MTVSERFTLLMKEMKKTSNSLAMDMGVTAPTIRKIEKGITLPSGKVLIYLSDNYNVNLNWLMSGGGDMFIDDSNEGGRKGSIPDEKIRHLEREIKLLEKAVEDKDRIISLLDSRQSS